MQNLRQAKPRDLSSGGEFEIEEAGGGLSQLRGGQLPPKKEGIIVRPGMVMCLWAPAGGDPPIHGWEFL